MGSEKNTQIQLLKDRIVYEDEVFGNSTTYEKVLNRLLEDSKFIALSIRYPFDDYSSIDLPTKYNNWQLRCSVEIYQNLGKENIKSYSENGINWTRDSNNISNGLLDEIMPTIGVIRNVQD